MDSFFTETAVLMIACFTGIQLSVVQHCSGNLDKRTSATEIPFKVLESGIKCFPKRSGV